MNSNNWRQPEQPPADGSGGDWRLQLQSDSRQRIVTRIMDTLKRHLTSSGQEGIQELRNIAMRFEEKIYHAATSRSDYLRRISSKMVTVESKSKPQYPASLDSTAQTSISESQEEVYQKIKVMKDLYYQEIHDIYQKICLKIQQQQQESLSQQAKLDGAEKLKYFKQMLENIMQVLQMSRSNAQYFHKDKLPGFEKQVIGVVNSHRPKKACPPLQQGQIHPSNIQFLQQNQHSYFQIAQGNAPGTRKCTYFSNRASQLTGITSSQPNMMNSLQLGLGNAPTEAPSTFLDSTARASISESPEEVYQKVEVMKDLYYEEIHVIYQKICLKIQQHDSLSQQTKSDGVERLKYFKQMLERILQILQMSMSEAKHFSEDKLPGLEEQILGVIDSHRPRSSRSSLDVEEPKKI